MNFKDEYFKIKVRIQDASYFCTYKLYLSVEIFLIKLAEKWHGVKQMNLIDNAPTSE